MHEEGEIHEKDSQDENEVRRHHTRFTEARARE